MILIVTEESDVSSNKVIEWLISFNSKFIRINNPTNILESINFNNNMSEIQFVNFNLRSIKTTWFRRGYIMFQFSKKITTENSENIKNKISNHLNDECETLIDYIVHKFINKPCINNPKHYNMNKLIALEYAMEVGFTIPETIITNIKSEATTFINKNGSAITKPIQDVFQISENGYASGLETISITVPQVRESFFYSLFQKQIIKRYELRVFVFYSEVYAACIFSQNSQESKIDSRINTHTHRNRIVPYNLPPNIKEKILKFMAKSALNSGSIDLIVTNDFDYIFLEVNPVGQFDYISVLCNFNIEKNIAEKLIELSNYEK